MIEYPPAELVILTPADIRAATVLERARAMAVAECSEADVAGLIRAAMDRTATPELIVQGSLLTYALAWQLRRRADPSITWETAQTWDVRMAPSAPLDRIADAEARASVEAAVATGLPPSEAGELTFAQVEAYAAIRKQQSQAVSRARTRRGRRR
jgi:hypothetical protein